jgi:predicted nuclease of predicted toxin-antitoxin system
MPPVSSPKRRDHSLQGSHTLLISADTDFGELLAVGRHPGPSVIILRRVSHRPEVQTELLLANLDGMEESLAAGAVVVLSAQHVRFRLLPISREE